LHEQVEVIHPQEIHQARKNFRQAMARSLQQDWLKIFERYQTLGDYSPHAEQSGRRALKNLALQMILENDIDAGSILAEKQFNTCNNMTDRLAALTSLVHLGAESAPAYLDKFYALYATNDLAIDKWFSIQASCPVSASDDLIEQIQMLKQHPAFKLRNPNRVRSLIHTFCMNNPSGFHEPSGRGYAFWLDQLLELDAINPQVAARLARALDRWKKFSVPHQSQMRVCLESALARKLSNDVSEVIHKALS
jgi:aminopeptidase N